MPTLTLESTVYTLQQLLDVPEAQVALAGRSNVGKSSLINALAVRKKLAKVSATPGKTRSINFYRVQPHNFFLVDLLATAMPGPATASAAAGRPCWKNIFPPARTCVPWPCFWTAVCPPRNWTLIWPDSPVPADFPCCPS